MPRRRRFSSVEIDEFRTLAEGLLTSPTLTYDQRLRQLAALAVNAMPYPDAVGGVPRGAGQAGHLRHVRRQPALHPALRPARLRGGAAPGQHAPRARAADRPRRGALVPDDPLRPRAVGDDVPGLPRRPRQAARAVRAPTRSATTSSTRSCAASGSSSTGCCPTPSCTPTSAPRTAGWPRSIFRVERSLRQVVPNITLKVDPERTPDEPRRGRRPHRLRDREAALRQPPDDGRRPRRGVRRGQLLQLAQDRRRRAHARPAQPQGGGAAARGWARGVPRDHPAVVRRADRRADGGADPLAGRAAALLRARAGWSPRGWSTSTGSRRCSASSASPRPSTC